MRLKPVRGKIILPPEIVSQHAVHEAVASLCHGFRKFNGFVNGSVIGHAVKLYRYGEVALSRGRFAIMAGGAKNTQIYEQLRDWGVNTFITGVTNPEVLWVGAIHKAAKANAVNLLGGTHYSTEKFAPMQMCRYFEAFGLPSEFLSETPRMTEL